MPDSTPSRHVIFFDRDCLLCDGTVKFLMKRDRASRLRFAPLQGETAAALFARHPGVRQNPEALTSIVAALDHDTPQECVAMKSTAVAVALRALGGFWAVVGGLLKVTPRPLRDWGYDLVARHRYRWFGKVDRESCPLPTPEEAARLLP